MWSSCLSYAAAFTLLLLGGAGILFILTCSGVPEDLDIQANLAYGSDSQQRLDIIAPKTRGPYFAVVLIHGGGWRGGSRHQNDDLSHLLAREGFLVANIDYRLLAGTRNEFPTAVEDVQQAVRWLRARSSQYHIYPKPMGGLGSSAGGHLVSMLGTCDTLNNNVSALMNYSSRLQVVVDINGPTDLTADFTGYSIGSYSTSQLVRDFMGLDLPAGLPVYKAASPLFHIDQNTAHFLIIHGDADNAVPVDQSKRFFDALQAENLSPQLCILPGQNHAFDVPSIRKIARSAVAFFKSNLNLLRNALLKSLTAPGLP
jgi:acetyl esterase/lipase